MTTEHVVTTSAYAIHRQAKTKQDHKCSLYLCPGVTIQLERKNTINKLRQDAGYYEFANTKCMLKILNELGNRMHSFCGLDTGKYNVLTSFLGRQGSKYLCITNPKKIKEQKEV